jgi:hypothetical protein
MSYDSPSVNAENGFDLDRGEAEALREQIETANTRLDEIEDLQLYVRHRVLLNIIFIVIPIAVSCVYLYINIILPREEGIGPETNLLMSFVKGYAAPIAIILTFILYQSVVALLGWSRQSHRLARAKRRLQEALFEAEPIVGARSRYRNTKYREPTQRAVS